jgi:hypothetical protein
VTITARYAGTCAECGGPIRPGDEVEWDRATRSTTHAACDTDTADGAPVTRTEHPPTTEQENALALFATGESMAIEAGAGTGKTTTLMLLANSTDRRGQYVAFNKAIVTEASEKFPASVACNTAHSLAYRAVGSRYAQRLRGSRRMRSEEIAARLGIDAIVIPYAGEGGTDRILGPGYIAGLVMQTVVRFCQSADMEPQERHMPYIDGIDAPSDGTRTYTNNNGVARTILPYVRAAWTDLMDENGVLPFRHDHYLKAWHLMGPRIDADYILFDEAQDANPVMQAIVAAQTHAQVVWVGDSQQSIYGFTGAINALAQVPVEHRAFLTQSFRFGPAVAEVANGILETLNAELRIVGTASISSRVEATPEPDAILCRTNATAVRTVMLSQAQGQRPHLVGGGDDVLRFARAANDLMLGRRTEHPDLACFTSWGEVVTYVAEDEQGQELRLLVKLVDEFGVPAIERALDRMPRERDADVIVSTAHKSKGREWPQVQLANDFPTGTDDEPVSADERRLLYVAVTRARLVLDITAVGVLA